MIFFRRSNGYTLVELLLTLSIVAILLSMAIPGMKYGYDDLRLYILAHQLVHELMLARSEAIKKQQNIRYIWDSKTGWEGSRFIQDEQGVSLHSFEKLSSNYHLSLRNSLGINNSVTFTPLGFTREQRSSFYLSNGSKIIRIVINVSGHVRVESNNPIKEFIKIFE